MNGNRRLAVRLALFPAAAIFTLAVCRPAPVRGAVDTWKDAVSGNFDDDAKWTDGSAPTSGDTARFDVSGVPYTVTFRSDATLSGLDATAGAVTLESDGGGSYQLDMDSVGVSDATTVTLGTAGKPLELSSTWFNIRDDGVFRVNGAGSRLITRAVSSPSGGGDALGGHLVFENSSTGNLISPEVAGGVPGSAFWIGGFGPDSGNVTVKSGSELLLGITEAARRGTSQAGLPGESATITVDGVGSRIECVSSMQDIGAIYLGHNSGTTATLNISNDGMFKTEKLWADPTATINLGTVGGGTLEITQEAYIRGATVNGATGGNLDLSQGVVMLVQLGGRITSSGDFALTSGIIDVRDAGSKLETTGGSSLNIGTQVNAYQDGLVSTADDLKIGTVADGNVNIAGDANLAVGRDLVLGADGFYGELDIEAGASATIARDLLVADSALSNGVGHLHIEDNRLDVEDIRVATPGLSGQHGEIFLTGGSLRQSGGSVLTLGANVGGSDSRGKLHLNAESSFTAGAGTALRKTGRITIDNSEADLKTLTYQGGKIRFRSGALTFDGDATIGEDGVFDESILELDDHELEMTGTLTVDPLAALLMEGGFVETGALTVLGRLYFNEGSILVTDPLASGLTIGGGPLGAAATLGAERPVALDVAAATTVHSGSQLTVDGGRLSTESLVNSGSTLLGGGIVDVVGALSNESTGRLLIGQSSTMNVSTVDNAGDLILGGGEMPIGDPGVLAGGVMNISGPLSNQSTGRLVVGQTGVLNLDDAAENVGELILAGVAAKIGGTGLLTNNGIIRGEGTIFSPLANPAAGEIRAESGKRIKFSAAAGANAGKINLQGGTAEFPQPLTNGPTGDILGRGTLITGSLTNQGDVALSSGIADVFGDVTNAAGGRMIISGNADVTFWDDVTNAGALMKVAGGSSATFFGSFGGAGITGPGDVFFEDDVTPGFSPGVAGFGGSVTFGDGSTLIIELGGPIAGDDFDQVQVADAVSLDGALSIELLGGFVPLPGDEFVFMTYGSRSGRFDAVLNQTPYAGLLLDVEYDDAAGEATLTAEAALLGDVDLDADVDSADLDILLAGFGTLTGADWLDGDMSGDSRVDDADLNLLLSNFGASLPAAGPLQTVPEPSALFLTLLGLLGLPAFALSRRPRAGCGAHACTGMLESP